uniref:Uncharacterized protein n=1 Tax=Xiphophorus couchianus TaxID=32473 RepID=A0A3B5LPE7_9TELE
MLIDHKKMSNHNNNPILYRILSIGVFFCCFCFPKIKIISHKNKKAFQYKEQGYYKNLTVFEFLELFFSTALNEIL